MRVAFWSLWGATAFLLIVFWSVEFQLISDLKTLPRTRLRMRGTAVQIACRAVDPAASHISPQLAHTSPAPGIAFVHPVHVDTPAFALINVKAPALQKMPDVHASDCLFDRSGSQLNTYRTTRLSWLSHGYGLSLLGPKSVDLFEEDVLLTESVCENLYNGSIVNGSLVPYRADLAGVQDALRCTERLALENKAWAGFYCQVHPLALLDVCPSLEAAQQNTRKCSLKKYIPPIRPGCCERIFHGDSFFRIRYNETGEAYFILKNQTLHGTNFPLAVLDETFDFANAVNIANYTDTFTLALGYNLNKPEFTLRANLLPLHLDSVGEGVIPQPQEQNASNFTLVEVTYQTSQNFNSSVCIVQNFSLNTLASPPSPPAHLMCTKGPEISEAQYACTYVDHSQIRGEFRSTPCPEKTEYTFSQQPGTGLLMYEGMPLCAREDTGLVFLGKANDDCYPQAGVFMYPTTINSGTQPRVFMATVMGTANQTQSAMRVAKWVVDPLQKTVFLEAFSAEQSNMASALFREENEPVWPGALGWKQSIPQDEFVGVNSKPVEIDTLQTQTQVLKIWTVEYAAPGFFFFFNGDDKALYTQTYVQKKVSHPNQSFAPTFTRVIPFQNMPLVDTTFYANSSELSANFVEQLDQYEHLKGACASETLHQYTTLFFSEEACAEAYVHVHWQFFSNKQSGYCTQDFTPRVQNNTFDCLAPQANGGASNYVSGYFRLDSLATNISEYLMSQPADISVLGFDMYVPAIAHFPAHLINPSPTQEQLECGYVPTDKTINYENMNLTMTFNLTKILPQLCNNYARRNIKTQGGWIGTRLVAGSACESIWPPFPIVQTEFSLYGVSDMQITGGSKYAKHTWPSPVFQNFTENQVTWEDGLTLCVERYEKARDLLVEMTYFPNMFLENSIRSSWIFARPEDYYGDVSLQCTADTGVFAKITCDFRLPSQMQAFAKRGNDNLKCDFSEEEMENRYEAPRCVGYFTIEITFPTSTFPTIKTEMYALMLGIDVETSVEQESIDQTNMAYFRRGYQAYILNTDLDPPAEKVFNPEDWLNWYDRGDMWGEYAKLGGNTQYLNRIDNVNANNLPFVRSLLYDRFLEALPRRCGTTKEYLQTKSLVDQDGCGPLKYLKEEYEVGTGWYLNASTYKDVRIHARFESKILYA